MIKYILIFLFLVTIINFSLKAQEVSQINIESKINQKRMPINLSDYVDKIEYIPLETKGDCLIDQNPKFTITEEEIVIKTISGCFRFDRKTGEFLNKIGKKGRGPGEYSSTTGLVNPELKTAYFSNSGNKLLKYNFEGTFIKSINIPECNNSFDSPSIPGNYTWLNNNIVAYFGNITGTEKKQLLILNEDGKSLMIYPNHKFTSKIMGLSVNSNESQFYHYNNNLYFKEDYSDTIFQVTTDQLIPKMILFTGKYRPPADFKWMNENEFKRHDYVFSQNLIESKSFFLARLFFQNKYFQVVCNKNTRKVEIAEVDDGLNNDIDGFIPFSPTTISTDGYLISYFDAFKILDWFKKNPEKASKLAPNLQKLRNIKETDNPVLMIAKIKE